MSTKSQVRYLTDANGQIESVVIPWSLWERMEPQIRRLLEPEAQPQALSQSPGPLKNFEDFLHFWNFKYAYSPAVACPHCGASAPDWREHAQQPFILSNANIGGLLVFHCRGCGATIRQKHFRDHMAVEHTPPPAP